MRNDVIDLQNPLLSKWGINELHNSTRIHRPWIKYRIPRESCSELYSVQAR